jgi:serine/threonine protein kinase/Tol biopolymer transport system component
LIGSEISHYEILERLGTGSVGSVYRARDLDLERSVALRVLPAGLFGDAWDRQRLVRDLTAAGALDHPNLCAVWDVGETGDGGVFAAMALCEGETLAARLARSPVRAATAADLGTQIAGGLARAHAAGVVHGNLRAANVMISADGQAKILDLGLAGLGASASVADDLVALGNLLRDMLPPDAPAELRRTADRASTGELAEAEEIRRELRAFRISGTRPTIQTSDETPTVSDRPSVALPVSRPVSRPLLPRGVSHYRVSEQLGGGGMGIIYKAEDTRLGRTVALKFLPPELTRDPVAKARFSQEARAASALDHPNICTIYDVGETDEAALFLAMPCYEGETLRERLGRGALPLAEAADIARQIAQGLAKAHRQGIVHRDIKPANLMITTDGVVKILDFGIAKLAGSAAITRTGVAVGTPAYMAPEQIRGDEVDHRADLWSLGVVLYEMLAGRRPFPDENDVLAFQAILFQEPSPLRDHRPDVPPELESVVAGLLRKSPAERTLTAEALLDELRPMTVGTLGMPVLGTAVSAQRRASAVRRSGPQPRPGWRALAVGAVLVILVAAVGLLLWRGGGVGSQSSGSPVYNRLTDQEGVESFPSLRGDFFLYSKHTPDGADIYLQRIGGGKTINLTPETPFEDSQPAFSPDGNLIAFRSERNGGGVFLMGGTGESLRRLTDFGHNPAWSPDGREIAIAAAYGADPQGRTSGRSQLWAVEVESGRRRLVAEGDAVQPSWSPNGLRIAYWGLPADGSRRVLWTIPVEGGSPVPVTDDDFLNWNPVWSPDGRYLYFASDRGGSMNLWRIRIDEASGEVKGGAEPITTPAEWSGPFSIGPDGRVVYVAREVKANLERVPFDPASLAVTGAREPLTQGSRALTYGKVSPDDRWIAVRTLAPQEDLFVLQSDGTGMRQITQDAFHDRGPVWLPDGRILFFSDRGGRYAIWSIRPDGSDLTRLTAGNDPLYQPVPSPDGRRLVCNVDLGRAALIDLTAPPEERIPRPLPMRSEETRPFFPSSWSRDGRRLAGYVQGRGGAVYSFETGAYEVLLDGGFKPVWMPDSRTILYLQDGKVFAYDLQGGAAREVLAPPPGSRFSGVDVSSDGRVLYLLRDTDESDVWILAMRDEEP